VKKRDFEAEVVGLFDQEHASNEYGHVTESYTPPVNQLMDWHKPLPTSNFKSHISLSLSSLTWLFLLHIFLKLLFSCPVLSIMLSCWTVQAESCW